MISFANLLAEIRERIFYDGIMPLTLQFGTTLDELLISKQDPTARLHTNKACEKSWLQNTFQHLI